MLLERLSYADNKTFDCSNRWLPKAKEKIIKDGNVARIVIINGNTQLLKGYDTNKISRINKATVMANRDVMKLISQSALNWNIITYATPEWAAQVFPDLSLEKALIKLWEGIF